MCQWWQTSDETDHFVRYWGASHSGPVVVYFHGIEGHGRWFEETALELNKKGISTYAFDRRGAGASREERGHIDNYRRLVLDAQEILEIIQRRHNSAAMFVVANCWGGKVALSALAGVSGIKGMVLTSPAVAVRVDVSFATKLSIGWRYLTGRRDELFDIPLSIGQFTTNPPYLEYIKEDPLRLTRATASFFVESLRLTIACRKAAESLLLPLLVLQSGEDQIVSVQRTIKWFNSLRNADKTLKIFTSAAHSLDFEPDPAEYQGLMADWILTRA